MLHVILPVRANVWSNLWSVFHVILLVRANVWCTLWSVFHVILPVRANVWSTLWSVFHVILPVRANVWCTLWNVFHVILPVRANVWSTLWRVFHVILPVRAKCLMYLMKCASCNLHYVGKSKTSFKLCLNRHKSDVFDRNAIPACCHFTREKHRFNKHVKFTWLKVQQTPINQKKSYRNFPKEEQTFGLCKPYYYTDYILKHVLNPEWLYPAIALFRFKFVVRLEVQFRRQTLFSRHKSFSHH